MEAIIIYFFVIFFSNAAGAISGMGGGVIIKPVLDFIGRHSLREISFYSCAAVFTMSISSTYRQIKNGVRIDIGAALSIAAGSLSGGAGGDVLLNRALALFGSDRRVRIIQYVIMILSLIIILIDNQNNNKNDNKYKREKKRLISPGKAVYFAVGAALGALSTFLGIGGGPVNVAAMTFFFGMDVKTATVYSIVTIFFAQSAKLINIGTTSGFGIYDLSVLWAAIPAALLGGYAGGLLSGKMKAAQVKKLYGVVVLLVLFINIYNLFTSL
jgi:uncharacterized membrane protein YfcA